MPRLPQKDEITFRWLIDRVPVTWWVAIIAALAAVFSAGVGAGRLSFQKLDGDISAKIATRDKLQSDVQNLAAEKAKLHAEVVRLQVEKETEQMTPEQVREALKQWTRD
jgi:outer membrane murein-binding lipoprotein Lpp